MFRGVGLPTRHRARSCMFTNDGLTTHDEGRSVRVPSGTSITADYTQRTAHRKEQEMAMELELGTLISKLIPYENAEIHLVPGDPKSVKGAMHQGLRTQKEIEEAVQANVNQALLEIETREREYISWQFKDMPRLVKRAVRVQYRHLYKSTGLWVTDHLLIGYEGSNGG
jgi:hypothetical protein